MHCFYFGDGKQPLYGVHHSPSASLYRQEAVLICNPIGQEYFRSHAVLRNLAQSLSSQGYHVLRFDYRGTGDSSGEMCDFSIEHWLDDIQMATSELRAVSGVDNISAVGLRIGGTLSLLSSTRCNFHRLILWDAVVDSGKYLDDLKKINSQLICNNLWFKYPRKESDLLINEYAGFLYSEAYIKSLGALNLMDSAFAHNLSVRYLFSADSPSADADNDFFKTRFTDYKALHMDERADWLNIDRLGYNLSGLQAVKCLSGEIAQ